MPLSRLLTESFRSITRQRGHDYFRQRRVRILHGSRTEVGAQVRGSDAKYQVMLQWTGSKLAVLCECPYFVDHNQPCKHLWATILASDDAGHLADAADQKHLDLDEDALLDQFDSVDDLPRSTPATRYAKERRQPPARVPLPPKPSQWKQQLSGLIQAPKPAPTWSTLRWPEQAEVLYVVDIPASRTKGELVLALELREPRKRGGWKNAKPLTFNRAMIPLAPTAADSEILSSLLGGSRMSFYAGNDAYDHCSNSYTVSPLLAQMLVPKIVSTGRCFLPHDKEEQNLVPLSWDEGAPWKFVLSMQAKQKGNWALTGEFRRPVEGRSDGTENRAATATMDIATPLLVTPGGFLITSGRVAPLLEDASFPWIAHVRNSQPILVPTRDRDAFLTDLHSAPALPEIELPEDLRYEQVAVSPQCCLKISRPQTRYGGATMQAELSFDYAGHSIQEEDARQAIYDAAARRLIQRDRPAEKSARVRLEELGLRYEESNWVREASWRFAPAKLPHIVRALVVSGWQVVAEGKAFRQPGASRAAVSSGVDWFELHGEVDYGDHKAQLPQLLQALKRGETMIALDDGTYGLLPEEWLQRFGAVAGMGEADGDRIRFRSNQAGLLDALLAAQPAIDCDATFLRARNELKRFEQIAPAEQPQGFVGQLRGYQCEGLGWMHFLRRFSFGGCLADDMGVGKTAQVLALLESRRALRAAGELSKPSLVVVPKSLIFNWKQEVARFTPQLTVLDYTGNDRKKKSFAEFDLVLTTYGTLRQDAVHFEKVEFDYLILDEAQAIKNSSTESAKAVRLLRGDHRLAMSGTPIENHLGELWSLFEFLNPGLLGASSAFQLTAGAVRTADDETRQLLARALRPFFLRRTKEQVAKELPGKIEQTIYCEMEPHQRTLYNDLRQHYRASLRQKISSDGVAKSKIHVLEALLRLRQAACHPGLIDPRHRKDPSAKLDVLFDQLREVLDEGHKALVFSQFTSLLSILRERLDLNQTKYEYLDGRTRDRQACVDRFQTDADCRLFLISLKAGGVGLNLTAADYVFILDPWWNPAVEAQAVDRAHRIGQTRQVFAYRLITRDTVEERVLELQQTKRNLADAILGAQSSLIRNLSAEDIELLLS